MRSVFFRRSPVNPSASSLRTRSAPPALSLLISVNSFACPAFVPGRALTVLVVAIAFSFVIQTCQPFQCPQSGHEAVLSSAHSHELRKTVKAAPQGVLWYGENSVPFGVTQYWILLCSVADKVAV